MSVNIWSKRSTETTVRHQSLQWTGWTLEDSPEGLQVCPGPDQAAPRAVCQRRSPSLCRSAQVHAGLPAAWRSAPAGWPWPPAPATPPTRAPRCAWARGWVLKVAPACEEWQHVCWCVCVCVMGIDYFRTLDCFLQAYHHFLCVCVLKVFLHDGCDCLLKVPLVQREDQRLIHAVFLSKHRLSYRRLTDVHTGFIFLTGNNLAVIPEHHRSWDPFYPPPQVRKPHQICPTRLYLQPHLQTKLHIRERQTTSWGRSKVSVMFSKLYSPRWPQSSLHRHVLSLKPVIKNTFALEVINTFIILFFIDQMCRLYTCRGDGYVTQTAEGLGSVTDCRQFKKPKTKQLRSRALKPPSAHRTNIVI